MAMVIQSFTVQPEMWEAIRRGAASECMTVSEYLRLGTRLALRKTGITMRPVRSPASTIEAPPQAQAA